MAKKSFKLVKASAALAVTAAAITPVIAAEASTAKAVELKSEVVLGGKFKEALALNAPKGVTITWGKYLVTAINKWQTVTGKGSDGKTYTKKLYARNYPLYILDQDLGEVEAGSELKKPSIRVMYRDGKIYTQAPERFSMSSTYNTKDLGAQKVLISYNHNGNRITSFLTYTVVAGAVEFSNVASSVDQASEVLSVTADVKNLKEGEKVELFVYPGKDMTAPIKELATVKEGKLTVSKKLPAGTHSFQLVSGEVKSEVKEFTVEAPMVKEVKAINAKELTVTFNKPVDKATLIDSDGYLLDDKLTATGIDTANVYLDGARASLSADGLTLTVAPDNMLSLAPSSVAFNGKYVVRLLANEVKTVSGVFFPAYTSPVFTADDNVRPSFSGLTYKATGEAVFTFSEPLNVTEFDIVASLTVNGPTIEAISTSNVTIAEDMKSFSIALPSTMTLDANYTFAFTGLKDYANNIINPNPISVTVVKSVRDNVKPTVSSIVPVDVNKVKVTYSEKIRDTGAKITVNGADVTAYTLDDSKTVATFTLAGAQAGAGVKTVAATAQVDLAGNAQDAVVSRVLQFSADTVAPAYVKHEVKTEGSTRYLVVSFDEKLSNTTGTVSGSYTDADNITRPTALNFFDTPVLSDDAMSVKVPLTSYAVSGNYTLNLPTNFAVDASANTNGSVARSISFSLGNVVDTAKPEVDVFAQQTASEVGVGGLLAGDALVANNNKVTVKFDRAVTAATALNVANYSIDGVSSPFTGAIFKGNAQTVELTLRDGAITTNGARNISIRNVATSTGSVMEVKNASYSFVENVRATVTSARVLSATQIEVTLSEALNETTDGGDFQVFQNGSTTALVESSEVATGNKVVITLNPGLTTLSGLVVKPESTINLADLNGNLVNFTGSVNVTN